MMLLGKVAKLIEGDFAILQWTHFIFKQNWTSLLHWGTFSLSVSEKTL
jgi:hypothetical protein